MTTTPQRLPDWFDSFWEKEKHRIPVYLRTDTMKQLARGALEAAIQSGAQVATTPQGIRALIGFARVTAILKGATGVLDAPDPSPDDVVAAVERLVQRVKP